MTCFENPMQTVSSENRSAAFVCTLDILHLIIDIKHFWHDFLGPTYNLSMISSQKNYCKQPFLQWEVSMDVNVLHGTNKEPVLRV